MEEQKQESSNIADELSKEEAKKTLHLQETLQWKQENKTIITIITGWTRGPN